MFFVHIVEHHAGNIMVYKCNPTCHMNVISKADHLWLCSKIPRLQIHMVANGLEIAFFLQVLST